MDIYLYVFIAWWFILLCAPRALIDDRKANMFRFSRAIHEVLTKIHVLYTKSTNNCYITSVRENLDWLHFPQNRMGQPASICVPTFFHPGQGAARWCFACSMFSPGSLFSARYDSVLMRDFVLVRNLKAHRMVECMEIFIPKNIPSRISNFHNTSVNIRLTLRWGQILDCWKSASASYSLWNIRCNTAVVW